MPDDSRDPLKIVGFWGDTAKLSNAKWLRPPLWGYAGDRSVVTDSLPPWPAFCLPAFCLDTLCCLFHAASTCISRAPGSPRGSQIASPGVLSTGSARRTSTDGDDGGLDRTDGDQLLIEEGPDRELLLSRSLPRHT